jgi:hypothetical protein
MLPGDWARAIHVRGDVRAMLCDIADYSNPQGQFSLSHIELMAFTDCESKPLQRMLSVLERANAIERIPISRRGPGSRVVGRLRTEIDPVIVKTEIDKLLPKPRVSDPGVQNPEVTTNGVTDVVGRNPTLADVVTDVGSQNPMPTRANVSDPGGHNPQDDPQVSDPGGQNPSRALGHSPTESDHSNTESIIPFSSYSRSIDLPSSSSTARTRAGPFGHVAARLTGPPKLSESERQLLLSEFANRFRAIGLGGVEAVSAGLESWALSRKAIVYAEQFPNATSWILSARDWLEHNVRYLGAQKEHANGHSNGRASGRGRPPIEDADYGFSEGRTIGEPPP